MMKYWKTSALNFVIGTAFAVFVLGFLSSVFHIIMGFTDVLDVIWIYRVIFFIAYLIALNWWIYGTAKKQRKYSDALSREHQITGKEDYFAFLKQEFLPILLCYAICLTLQVFVLRFTKGYFQAFFVILAPLGVEMHPALHWLLSFLGFVIGYQVIAVLWRKHIRKDAYDYLFENQQTNA